MRKGCKITATRIWITQTRCVFFFDHDCNFLSFLFLHEISFPESSTRKFTLFVNRDHKARSNSKIVRHQSLFQHCPLQTTVSDEPRFSTFLRTTPEISSFKRIIQTTTTTAAIRQADLTEIFVFRCRFHDACTYVPSRIISLPSKPFYWSGFEIIHRQTVPESRDAEPKHQLKYIRCLPLLVVSHP